MIIIKVFGDGDIHAEDNDGQMIVARNDGSISTYLHGDADWVHGESKDHWDAIGFHLGLTDGRAIEQTRSATIN